MMNQFQFKCSRCGALPNSNRTTLAIVSGGGFDRATSFPTPGPQSGTVDLCRVCAHELAEFLAFVPPPAEEPAAETVPAAVEAKDKPKVPAAV